MSQAKNNTLPVHGWVNFNKPYRLRSTSAVGKVKHIFNARKAGHAGTLDPLATGVLPIALGEATKTIKFLMEAKKTYEFEITWGTSTDTQDAEGEVVAKSDKRPSYQELADILPKFTGEIYQIPPIYSAVKIKGNRAYDLARAGEPVILKPRRAVIDGLDILTSDTDAATLRVDCGKGTYVRALARDIAAELGAEAYVSALKRTRVGPFSLEDAFSLDALEELRHKRRAADALLPFETALDDIPVLDIDKHERFDLQSGRVVALHPDIFASLRSAFHPRIIDGKDASRLVLAKCEDRVIALCEARAGHLRPRRLYKM